MHISQRAVRSLRRLVAPIAFTLVLVLVTSTQSLGFSTATIYNPLSLSNSTVGTYDPHPVYYFQDPGWSGQFAEDLTAPGMSADAPLYMWGANWGSAGVLGWSGSPNPPISWPSYAVINGICQVDGTERAIAFALNLPNGPSAGFSMSHLSKNDYYAPGATLLQGAQVGNLSWLAAGGVRQYSTSACDDPHLTSTGPHVHVESARSGTTTYNDVDPVSGPAGDPYWYYNYP